MSQQSQQLSGKLKKSIEKWKAKFPKGKQASAVIMSLRLVQDEYGHLEDWHIDAVAKYLKMPVIQVQEVSSFYSMYRHKAEGRFRLKVCNSISCYLKGSEKLLRHFSEKLGVDLNSTTEDGLFSLQETECLGACCQAPCMLVGDDDYQMDMDIEKANCLILKLKKGIES